MKKKIKPLSIIVFTLYLFLIWVFFIDRGLIIHKLFGVYWSFIRPLRFQTTNFIPSVSAMLDEEKAVLLLNLTAFIPMGFFICCFTRDNNKYKNISFLVLIPIVIEILQYIFATGALDINDIILNTVSGLIGVIIFAIIKKFIKNKK